MNYHMNQSLHGSSLLSHLMLKRFEGELIDEKLLLFKKLVLQCPTHGWPDDVFRQYFYQSFDWVNIGVADQLSPGGLIHQPYFTEDQLLDGMITINRA